MNLIKKLIVAGCFTAALASCKKDNLAPDDRFLYRMDGVSEAAKPSGSSFSDNTLMIEGTKGADDITLFIDTNIGVGTYHIGTFEDSNIIATYVNWDNSIFFTSTDGTLTINSINDTHISGTFRFAASSDRSTKNFTEGQFSTKIEYMPDSPPPSCLDSTYEVNRRNSMMFHIKEQHAGSLQ